MNDRTSSPLLSIVVPAYNAECTLARAIDSVLEQDIDDLEVIVVDDGSSDGTVAWLQARVADEPRLRLVRQPNNQGPAAARNAGLDAAQGTWVGLLDADDAWLPGRAKHLIDLAERYEADMVADNQWLYDVVAQRMVRKGFAMRMPIRPLCAETLLSNDISGGLFVFGWLKPLMRRAFMERHRLRYLTQLRYGEDFNLYMRMLGLGARGVLTREAMYVYTQRTGSISMKRSEHSHTMPNMAALHDDMTQLMEQLGPVLSARTLRLMRRRAFHLSQWPRVLKVRELVSRRDYLSAALIFARHPASASALSLALYTRIRQRLGFI